MMKIFFRKNKIEFTKKGFTLIELIITVSVVVILSGLATASLRNLTSRNAAQVAERQLRSHLRKAQIYAMSGRRGYGWGVYYAEQTHQATLYCFCGGTDYVSHPDMGIDESIYFPKTVTVTGMTDIAFAKTSGLPTPSSSTITITGPTGGSATLTISSEGSILGN